MAKTLRTCSVLGAIVIGIAIFRCSLSGVAGIGGPTAGFLSILLIPLLAGLTLAIGIIWALIYLVWQLGWGDTKWQAPLPLLVMLGSAAIAMGVFVTPITIYIDFYLHLHTRQQVVANVQQGKLGEYDYGWRRPLPWYQRHLSNNGTISWGRGGHPRGDFEVLFPTFGEFLDNFSGFVYTATGKPPQRHDFDCSYVIETKRMSEHWYWLACS